MTDTPEKIHLTLKLSPELNHILEELVQKIGTNKNEVLRQAITLMQRMVTEKEQTLPSISPNQTLESLSKLDPWTQSLIGVICLESENTEESYVNYLEGKYS